MPTIDPCVDSSLFDTSHIKITISKGHTKRCKAETEENVIKQTRKHMCSQCPNIYSSPSDLKEHVAIVHTKEINVDCEYCGKEMRSREALKKHLILK